MMKYLTILAIFFASTLQSTSAAADTQTTQERTSPIEDGFRMDGRRDRKVIRKSELEQLPESLQDLDHLRQWKEEDYEAIMSVMSGTTNLRQRKMQHTNGGEYEKKAYYTSTQTRVTDWQKIALWFFITLFVALAFYIYALKRELSTLNQYLPLGYKLFADTEDASEEQERPVDGVEMS